jgi:hypothetical protein
MISDHLMRKETSRIPERMIRSVPRSTPTMSEIIILARRFFFVDILILLIMYCGNAATEIIL